MALIDRIQWQSLSVSQQVEQAQTIANQLPLGWRYNGVRHCEMGDINQYVAMFTSPDNGVFAFVPGGEINLGFNVNNWQPTQAELESYAQTQSYWREDPFFEMSLLDFIATNTTNIRSLSIQSLLVETTSSDVYHWEEIDFQDQKIKEAFGYQIDTESQLTHQSVQNVLSEYLGDLLSTNRGVFEVGRFKLERGSDGLIRCYMKSAKSYLAAIDDMNATGFRYPTSEEWEYICGAGSSTLFRWGNRFVNEQTERWTDKVWYDTWKTSGCLSDNPTSKNNLWNLHQSPNAFGILIADNPYVMELVSQPAGVLRGGDGGQNQSAGTGMIPVWLALATSFFSKTLSIADSSTKIPMTSDITPGFTGRRVLPLKTYV